MKGDTRILDLFLLFRMSKEEIIGLINEKQPVVFVSGEHAYMVRDYRCDMTEQTPRMLSGQIGYNYEKAYERCQKKMNGKNSNDDIGEDAMALAVKYGGNGKKKSEKSDSSDSGGKNEEINT